jgi:DNA mismatch repair ATPase MutL
VGQRFCTSKCVGLQGLEENVRTYGFRGEALSSIREVGTLDLTTRSSTHLGITMTKRMDHINTAHLWLRPAMTARASHGTTITVTGIFARWAVRRKALRPSVEIDGVIRRVQCLALINNGISFTLINASTGTRLVSSHKARSVATIFGQLFGDAKARTLIPLPAMSGDIDGDSDGPAATKAVPNTTSAVQVHGYLAVEGHHSRALQFVFVNGRRCVA